MDEEGHKGHQDMRIRKQLFVQYAIAKGTSMYVLVNQYVTQDQRPYELANHYVISQQG